MGADALEDGGGHKKKPRERNLLVNELHQVTEGLLLATSLANVLLSSSKRTSTAILPYAYLPSSNDCITVPELCIALLHVIGELDATLERTASYDTSLSVCYDHARDHAVHTASCLEDVITDIFQSMKRDDVEECQNKISTLGPHRSDGNASHDPSWTAVQPSTVTTACNCFDETSDLDKMQLLIEITESLWLSQSLINVLLGIQNPDIQRYENRKKSEEDVKGAGKKSKRKTPFSSTVLHLLCSGDVEMRTLFATGVPRCLRIKTVLCLWGRLMESHVGALHTQWCKNVESLYDVKTFTLAYALTELALVILVDDTSSSLVRYAALVGLQLLSMLPNDFGIVLLLMGLRKPQMNGSQACDTKNALKGVDAIGTPTSHKWKRLPRFRSSMASAVNVALDDHKKHRVDNEEHLVTNPPHALAVCSTHASFLVHQEARDKECVCLLCERPMTSITQEERPPHMALTPSAAWVAQPRSVLGVTVAEQQWIQQELNNLASRVPGLSHRVAHELYVEQLDVIHPRCISLCSTADVSSSPSSSPSCTAPSYATAAGGVSMAPPTPTLTSFACIHAWTFPAHGWLLRALDEASDPRIRQATLDLLVRVFTSHMHHPAVPELRFKIHLPLLQSIFDLDPHVLESAVECIVVASHLAPLKDGAAHKLVAFFTSCTQQQWSFSLFRLLERCCYYDASALKVLVKGLMNVLFKNTAHNDMFLLCFSQFFFAVDVSLSLETNSERHFFSFWHPSIEVPPNCTLDDHNLWLLVFLRSCYRIGRRHFSHISSVYDSQSITSLDISTYDDYKLRGYKANVPLPLQGLEALGLLCLMLGAGLKYCIQPQLSAPHCFKDSLFIFLQGPPTTLLSSEYQWVHWCYMGNPPGCSF